MEATTRTTLRKTRVGRVVSDKMDKTAVVAIEEHVKHAKYGRLSSAPLRFTYMTRTTSARLETK